MTTELDYSKRMQNIIKRQKTSIGYEAQTILKLQQLQHYTAMVSNMTQGQVTKETRTALRYVRNVCHVAEHYLRQVKRDMEKLALDNESTLNRVE